MITLIIESGGKMYASDGLPQWYYDVLNDKFEMLQMKEEVFQVLDTIKENHEFDVTEPTLDDYVYEEICDLANVSLMFECEVSDFVAEWMEQNQPTAPEKQLILA